METYCNILLLFNLGWWLQHSVAALLLFLKQLHNKILFDLALQKCFVATLQKVHRCKCLICLNVATAKTILFIASDYYHDAHS